MKQPILTATDVGLLMRCTPMDNDLRAQGYGIKDISNPIQKATYPSNCLKPSLITKIK
ncbi:hypothetical protein [Niastella yeongjuensis]|uniref:hypothetical protein n=1 Tax=Niastella yeongjuensis TaxID=354355 RepID=UPI0008AE9C18|nr:hypothetical protein [Niastella yeongjuensis]SEP27129.1 hypothetical protein SAMN05660816_05035 [Niastella yeongjuensis]